MIKGKANMLSLGVYPDVSLKDARERRDEARKLIANGIAPSEVRKAEKTEAVAEGETVELVGREWHDKFKASLTERSAAEILHRLERDVFPWIGSKPIKDVTAPELLAVVRRIEYRGAPETARRCLQYLSRICEADLDEEERVLDGLSQRKALEHFLTFKTVGTANAVPTVFSKISPKI